MYKNETLKLLSLSGIDINTMMASAVEEVIANIKEHVPDIPESELARFRDKLYQNINIESLSDLYAPIYSCHLSHEEMVGLIAFWESPLGRKSAQVNPQITQEIQAMSQVYFESLANEVLEEMAAEGLT